MKEKIIFSKNISEPLNPPDELAQNVLKKSISDELFLFFESSESDRFSNYLHDSNSIFRESMMVFGWLASTGRPDMAAPHSIIPWYDRRSPHLISEVNAAVKPCHAVPITTTIWPILFVELRWTSFTDSGFDTGERQRHQRGLLVCATNKYFNQERSAPVSVLHWRSRKARAQRGESTTDRDLCRKFRSVGDGLDQSIVGIDDLERF